MPEEEILEKEDRPCPKCEGSGQIEYTARVYHDRITPPYEEGMGTEEIQKHFETCWKCYGSGKVPWWMN